MKKNILLVFLFVFLGAASGFLTYKVILLNKRVTVPDLKGKPPEAADSELSDLGLKMKVTGKDFDPVVPPGSVTAQEPAADTSVKLDSIVKVALSLGPATPRMPSVIGRDLADAVSFLEKSGLRVLKTIFVHSGNIPKGTVMAQDPNPGEKSGPVSLIVSSGPSEVSYYCPDFTGMALAQAQNLSTALGLQPVVEGGPANTGPGSGQTVASQKPGPGDRVFPGQEVFLFMSAPGGTAAPGMNGPGGVTD